MTRPHGGATLIVPGATPAGAAKLPGMPQALVQALAASAASKTVGSAIESGRGQRLVAALLAVEARLRLTGPSGGPAATHDVPVDERLTLDGRLLPRDGEALSGIVVRSSEDRSVYRESRPDQIGLAARIGLGDGPQPRVLRARVVWWGLATTPFIAREVEGVLQGRTPDARLIDVAAQTARTEAQPAGAGMELDADRLEVVTRLCRDTLSAVLLQDTTARI